MGIFDKLFGKKKQPPPPQIKQRRPPPEEKAVDPAEAEAEMLPAVEEMSAKQLNRKLGEKNDTIRQAIVVRLGKLQDRSSIRPLINAYLTYGDSEALESLRGYGSDISQPMREFAQDMSNVGERRARVMDILAVTGDDQVLPLVREGVEHKDPAIRSRACAALVALGDLHGIGRLDQDLQTTDPEARRLALQTLIAIGTHEANRCVDDHVERFVAESGAVSHDVIVTAPRLDNPSIKLIDAVVERLKRADRQLIMVIGSEAIGWATNERVRFQTALPDASIHFGLRRMVPEEQIAELIAARDVAANGGIGIFMGMVPSPRDDTPAPHFLTRAGEAEYRALILHVDPHEYLAVQAWWQYVEDQADVDTVIEAMLGVSRPGQSAITEEEYSMYRLLKDDEHRERFVKALLARM